jgi:hypothetical protein
MYETLCKLWQEGKLTEAMLDKAVTLGWITPQQKAEIMLLPKNTVGSTT